MAYKMSEGPNENCQFFKNYENYENCENSHKGTKNGLDVSGANENCEF